MSETPAATPVPEKKPILLEIASIALLVLATFGSFLTGARRTDDVPELIGSGMAPVIITLVVLGIARLFRAAKTRRSVATIAFWTLVVVCVGTCGSLITPSGGPGGTKGMPPLTAEQKAPPVISGLSGARVLCQQALGIRVEEGDFDLTPDSDLQAKIASGRADLGAWAYRDRGGSVVLILGARGFDSEKSLRNFVAGFAKSASKSATITDTAQQLEWHDSTGTLTITATNANGSRMVMRCMTSASGTLGCIQTTSADPSELQALRGSLSVNECR